MRPRFGVLSFTLLAASALPVRADAIYDVVFTGGYPAYPPTVVGTLVLNTPPPANGTAIYLAPAASGYSYTIDSLDIYPDQDDFNLSDIYPDSPSTPAVVQFVFTDGTLTAISGELSVYAYRSRLYLGSSAYPGTYPLIAEYFDGYGTESSASVSLTPAMSPPAPTPEPSTLALIGTGLLGLLTRRALT